MLVRDIYLAPASILNLKGNQRHYIWAPTSMKQISKHIFCSLALVTQRFGFHRLSSHLAGYAGFFDHSPWQMRRDWRIKSLAGWVRANATVSISLRFHLVGYDGLLLARPIRRLIAGSTAHRAWLSGVMGIYTDDKGQRFGVCDREWTINRKAFQDKSRSSVVKIAAHLIAPWSIPYRPA